MTRTQFNIIFIAISAFSFGQVSFSEETLEANIELSRRAYPTQVLKRPFTLPANTGEVAASIKMGSHEDNIGRKRSDLASLNWLSVGYGVTDDFQLGLSWGGFQFPRVKAAQSINVSAGYFLFANSYMASMASLEMPIHFQANTFRNVTFAMPTAFGVVQDVSVLAFYDSLVDVSFGKNTRASFNFPIKLGYQVTPNLWLDISTRLAKFEAGPGAKQTYIWKSAPIKVKGLYAINNTFDVTAETGFENLQNAKDSFSFIVGAQYRIGNLDG